MSKLHTERCEADRHFRRQS